MAYQKEAHPKLPGGFVRRFSLRPHLFTREAGSKLVMVTTCLLKKAQSSGWHTGELGR